MLRLSLHGGFSLTDAGGTGIHLKSKKAKALLAYLALPPGKARSREEIMALLWSDRGEAQARGSLRQVLSGIRKELGADALAALRITDESVLLDPDHVAVEDGKAGDELLAGFHLNDPAFEEWLRDERLRSDNAQPGEVHSTKLLVRERPSIAVLPFTNMSGDTEQEYFSDGITEDIITELSRFRELLVMSRNTTFAFKGKSIEVSDLGQTLGVQYVLEGSVRRSVNRVRITAQLVAAGSGRHIWADRYDRELDDVFAVQDDVVRAIVGVLPGRLSAEHVHHIKLRRPDNLNAYDLVLQANQLMEARGDKNVEQAISLYKRAIEFDPGYAAAYVGLCRAECFTVFDDAGRLAQEAIERAIAAGRQAVSLDDNNGAAQAALGIALLYVGEHDLSKHHAERAVVLNPNNAIAHYYLAAITGYCGDPDRGIEMLEAIQHLDPFLCQSHTYLEEYGDLLYMAGRYEDAIAAFKRIVDPVFYIDEEIAFCYGQLGRQDEVEKHMYRFEQNRPPKWDSVLHHEAHMRLVKTAADREHWTEGYRKAGVGV
jgi:adenylate cyclase